MSGGQGSSRTVEAQRRRGIIARVVILRDLFIIKTKIKVRNDNIRVDAKHSIIGT
jgi:hypothetical protein